MRLIDAFCGTGGWSSGAIAAGVQPVLGIDCDHTPLQLWAANCAPAGRATCATLGTDEPVEWPAAEPDIHIHLSPPCTSLSKARAGSAPAASVAAALDAVRWCVELVLERKYTSWSLENVAVPSVVACVRELASAHPARVAYVVLDAADNGVSSNRVRLIASTPEVIRALKEMPVRRVSVADAFAAAGLPLPADFIKSNTSNRDGTPCVRSVTARPRQPPRALDAPTLCARPYGAGAAVELHGHSEPPTHMEHARRHHRALLHCRRKRRPHGLSTRLAAAAGLARRTARRRQRRGRRLSKRPSSGRQHRGWLEARARVRARCRAGPILPPHPRPGTAAAGPRRDGRRRARPRARAGRARAGRAPGGRRRPRRPPRAPAQAPPPHGARGRPRGRGGPGAGPRGHARESQVPRRGEPPRQRSRLARPRRVQRSLSIYYYSMYYYLLSYLYIQEFSSVLGFDFLPQMSKWLYGRKGKPPTDF